MENRRGSRVGHSSGRELTPAVPHDLPEPCRLATLKESGQSIALNEICEIRRAKLGKIVMGTELARMVLRPGV